MNKVYQYDNFGFYVGETTSYGNMPHNCTDIAPPDAALGEWERYQFADGTWWVVANDYRGAQGYVDGALVTVKTPELPEGFSFNAPVVEVDETEPQPTLDDRITALEEITLEMMLGGANV